MCVGDVGVIVLAIACFFMLLVLVKGVKLFLENEKHFKELMNESKNYYKLKNSKNGNS